jgi:hypothetical protein
MLQSAIMHQIPTGDLLVFPRQAECESKVDFWVWVCVRGAKFYDVAQTFRGSVLADYFVLAGG